MFRFAQHDKLQNYLARLVRARSPRINAFEICLCRNSFAPLRWMISKKSVGRSSTGLCEDLQQITFIIAIDEDPEPLQCVQFLIDVTNAIEQRVVVCGRNFQELEPALL